MERLDIWNQYMRSYDFLTQVDSYVKNLSDIVDALNPAPGMRILDAGSGTGNLSIALKQRGAAVTSCDVSESALARHREKDAEAELLRASLEEALPLESASYDAVCCASVLFALPKDGCVSAVREFARVLRPGGQLIATVPSSTQKNGNLLAMHFGGLRAKRGIVRGYSEGIRDLPALARILYYNRKLNQLPDWQGFHRFTEEELNALLSSAGFKDVHIGRTYGGNFLLAHALAPQANAGVDSSSSMMQESGNGIHALI